MDMSSQRRELLEDQKSSSMEMEESQEEDEEDNEDEFDGDYTNFLEELTFEEIQDDNEKSKRKLWELWLPDTTLKSTWDLIGAALIFY